MKILDIYISKKQGYKYQLLVDIKGNANHVWCKDQKTLDSWLEQTNQIDEFSSFYNNISWYQKTQELKKSLYQNQTLFPEQ